MVLLQEVLPFPARILFVAPVAIASRYGGRGPAIAASALGVLAIRFSFGVPTVQPILMQSEPWIYALLFAVVAFTIDSSSQALRRSRREVESRAAQLEAMNSQLEQQMEEVQALSEHLHEANVSLEAARDQAIAATHTREEVLAVVAHDLRNPLNLVTMTAQLFAEIEPSGDRRRQLLEVMPRQQTRFPKRRGRLSRWTK